MDETLMRRAIELSRTHMHNRDGGPFGALIARNGRIVAEGWNAVTSTGDPTAHAEVMAIRAACKAEGNFELQGADLYTSCEPCPMCLAAAYWARVGRIFYAASKEVAARFDFDDEFLYRELVRPVPERTIPTAGLLGHEAEAVFREWETLPGKIPY